MKRKRHSSKIQTPLKREARKWNRITQQRIATELGLKSREYVNRVITGRYPNPELLGRIRGVVSLWISQGKSVSYKMVQHLYGGDR